MEHINKQLLKYKFVRSEEAKRILKSLENLNEEVKAFHKKLIRL